MFHPPTKLIWARPKIYQRLKAYKFICGQTLNIIGGGELYDHLRSKEYPYIDNEKVTQFTYFKNLRKIVLDSIWSCQSTYIICVFHILGEVG